MARQVLYMRRVRAKENVSRQWDRYPVSQNNYCSASFSCILAACQEIFLRMPPPPNYETTLKNDRRSMSAIETNTTQQASEVVLQVEQPNEQQRVPDQQPSSQAAPEALRRVQSNVEAVPPASNLGPPAYSRRLVHFKKLYLNVLFLDFQLKR